MDEPSQKKFLTKTTAPYLAGFAELARATEPFSEAELEAAANKWMEANGVTMKECAQAVRVALTGKSAAPGLYEIMLVLGREESVRRLLKGKALAESAP
jgi:glutamyl-tRNA synthetase